jgi:hypothetical protein
MGFFRHEHMPGCHWAPLLMKWPDTIPAHQIQFHIINRDQQVWVYNSFGEVLLALANAVQEQGRDAPHAIMWSQFWR